MDVPPDAFSLDQLSLYKNYPDDELAPILPRFFVPRLSDKPQNPIMDTLKLTSDLKGSYPFISSPLPSELSILIADTNHNHLPRPQNNNIWLDAIARRDGYRNQALSWDRLRTSHPTSASSTGFLSEQESLVFSAARYFAHPRLRDPSIDIVYVTQNDLLKALKMTILGISSVFHIWEASTERFVQIGIGQGRQGFLLMDGKDQVISQSLISRLLTIGTLLRRFEMLLTMLRARSAREGPTIHAYAHALSTIISFLRNALSQGPPNSRSLGEQLTLSAIWMHYGIYEEIVVALSSLYHREEDVLPDDYPPIDSSPVQLLSCIYENLNTHLERQSNRTIVAILAFILTNVSHEYLQQVSQSIGYGLDAPKKVSRTLSEKRDQYTLEDEEEDEKEELLESPEILGDIFPTFFPPELLDILPAAQKSLVLLQAADPDHQLLKHTAAQSIIRWFWTKPEIEAAWYGNSQTMIDITATSAPSAASPGDTKTQAEFSIFKLFDREPSLGLSNSINEATSKQSLHHFIELFPHSLPSITPTLTHVTSLVFFTLVQHASTLSNALLSLFLSSSGNLNFLTHLRLLRSYLLLTAPPFKDRLKAALFSDLGDFDDNTKIHSMSIRSARQKMGKQCDEHAQPWAVGLAPALLERGMWPPVGADLSFFLRTVIVDSIDKRQDIRKEDEHTHQVFDEAEYRLGFAIRDLPTGPGRDKWLNPLSIEALDFLYMDYKPPHPLEVLITPEILAKYQRIFAFIIRLMRVESALASLYRMTRRTSDPLFPTLAWARKLLLHFRFVAQSFVANLSEYVFDTAIGGNFDPFMERLAPNSSLTPPDSASLGFSDVFSLARGHSELLDNILSACLLRSGQRAVGDLLRHALELILEFIIIVGELHRRQIEEYQAAPLLEDVSKKFLTKMMTLTKVLKGLIDKNTSTSKIPTQGFSSPGGDPTRNPTGGADALYHLLIRLDISNWWSSNK